MRLLVAIFALLAFSAGALAYPPATIEDVDHDSLTVAGLDCDTLYRIRVEERRSGAWRDAQLYQQRTAPCSPPPDSDGDGVPDASDQCPNEPGTEPNGCLPPDSDGDGVPNSQDQCPNEAGTEPNGCKPRPPDSDGDGFPDGSDLCPHEAGVAPDGCPEVVPPHPSHDPACAGYPEPRVYLESQSWWEPQNGPASHPGTGKQGHIHIETCFPLYHHYSGSETVQFDYTVRLHNMPGQLVYVASQLYGEEQTKTFRWFTGGEPVVCPVADCVFEVTATLDLSRADYSGLHVATPVVRVSNEPGVDGERHDQHVVPYWPIYLDSGKPVPPAGSVLATVANEANQRGLIGDTYYQPAGPAGGYAMAAIARQDLPYLESPLRPKVISGVWDITAYFEKTTGFVYVDPMLHANPPTKGTVFYEGPGGGGGGSPQSFRDVSIDTTQLSDGPHKLLVGTCNTDMQVGGTVNGQVDRGDHCGTTVVRFLVDN